MEAQWRQVTERLRNAQEAIQTQQQAGLLTGTQARQQIVALQQQSATEMERLLPTMQQAAQAIRPDAVIRVQAWRNELDRTKLTVDEMAPLWNRIGESFGGALNGMITGAQTWRSARRASFQQVADAFLQQIVIQPFPAVDRHAGADAGAQARFHPAGADRRCGGQRRQVAQRPPKPPPWCRWMRPRREPGRRRRSFHSLRWPGTRGGRDGSHGRRCDGALGWHQEVRGGPGLRPGSATSDSIPARLSAGEYVVRAAAVRQVGVAFLDSLNGLSAGPRFKGGELAFAAGGLVPEVKVPPAQPQMNQAVRIVNAVDPGVTHDHLQSPAGEKVIVNIIGRNARPSVRRCKAEFSKVQWHFCSSTVSITTTHRPWTALAIRGSHVARRRICRRRPPASMAVVRPPMPCVCRKVRGGGYVKNLDATKTSLIVGAPFAWCRTRTPTPSHCCWACVMPTRRSRIS